MVVPPPPYARCNFRWKFSTAPIVGKKSDSPLNFIIAHPLGKL